MANKPLTYELYKLHILFFITDCQDDKLSKMKKLILAIFDKEQRKKATMTRLIDELYFRYNKDGDHRVKIGRAHV